MWTLCSLKQVFSRSLSLSLSHRHTLGVLGHLHCDPWQTIAFYKKQAKLVVISSLSLE